MRRHSYRTPAVIAAAAQRRGHLWRSASSAPTAICGRVRSKPIGTDRDAQARKNVECGSSSRGGVPLGFVDPEALRRSERPGEVLRPVDVDGFGGHAGGPGGMLEILQF